MKIQALNCLVLIVSCLFGQSPIPFNSDWIGETEYIHFAKDSLIFFDDPVRFDWDVRDELTVILDKGKYIFMQSGLDTTDFSSNNFMSAPWLIVNSFVIKNDTLKMDYIEKEFVPGDDSLIIRQKKYTGIYIKRQRVIDESFQFDSLLYEIYPYKLFVSNSGEYRLHIQETAQNKSIIARANLPSNQIKNIKLFSKMACPNTTIKTWDMLLHVPKTRITFYKNNEQLIFRGYVKPRLFWELCNYLDEICYEKFKFDYNRAIYGE